ncbi:MAG TPA: tripartite tricarboxylate transporter substrate binding protein [Casimicrobiaceae bacterium]|nr:tripartite tricarboxylate transporter substrate binding protein [Casimicrobiaceae bacterium]
MTTIRLRLRRLIGALALAGSFAAQAADFPSKPITLVVPFAPGGFVHAVALMFGESMGAILGQPVVVVNQPGVNGSLAANNVARAAADGYTIFIPTTSILTINPHLYKSVQYDPRTDFVPIGTIVSTSNLFVVNPASGIKSLKDIVDRARAQPGQISYGSSGSGSIQHIAGELLQQQAKIKLLHVPYKGIGPAVTDVMTGSITFVFSDASAIPNVKGGKLAAIAVSPRALDELPGVPSLAEAAPIAGVPQFAPPVLWYGLVAPKGTPADVVAKLNAAMVQSLNKSDIRQKLTAAGAIAADNPSGEHLASVIRAEYDKYGALLKSMNIAPE